MNSSNTVEYAKPRTSLRDGRVSGSGGNFRSVVKFDIGNISLLDLFTSLQASVRKTAFIFKEKGEEVGFTLFCFGRHAYEIRKDGTGKMTINPEFGIE